MRPLLPELLFALCYFLGSNPCFGITDLCAMAARLNSSDSKMVRQVYRTILAESLHAVDLASLDQAILKNDPFAIKGGMHLFIETAQALNLLKKHIAGAFTEEESTDLHEDLLAELALLAPDFGNTSYRPIEVARVRAGLRAPLSIETKVPSLLRDLAAAQYSRDGKYLVTVSRKGAVRTYLRTPSGFSVHYSQPEFITHPQRVGITSMPPPKTFPFSFSSDGRYFSFVVPIALHENLGPYVFELETGQRKYSFLGSNNGESFYRVTTLEFSPDNQLLAVSGRNSASFLDGNETSHHLWSLDGHLQPRISFHANVRKGGAVAFSPDSRFFFHALNALHAYDCKENSELVRPTRSERTRRSAIPQAQAVAAHPFRKWLAIQAGEKKRNRAPWNGSLYLLDYTSIEEEYEGVQDNPLGSEPRFRQVRMSSLPTHELQSRQTNSEPTWNGLKFSPDGRYLVSGIPIAADTPQASLEIFEIGQTLDQTVAKPIATLLQIRSGETKVEFSRDSRYLLVLDNIKIHVYNVPKFDLAGILEPGVTRIFDFSLSPDRRHILTVDDSWELIERNFFFEPEEEAIRILNEGSSP